MSGPAATARSRSTRKRRPWLARLLRRLRSADSPLLKALPAAVRFKLFRNLVDCEAPPDPTFELKIAETREELEACFGLLHDAYVASGFMRPHPSGLRVTPYHALPTTTTLCAKIGGKVVGTLSIVREGVFGFPMQTAFDIASVRAKEGRIAEISALAIHPSYRRTGGTILFSLMKFMYEYCTQYFDTRHLVIAVHPKKIEMYESLLFFRRLAAQVVDNYDFANGAPAIGATLDLHEAPDLFRAAYDDKPAKRNLYEFFVKTKMPQIKFPGRPWHISNDPVLTPELVHYFFNERTQGMSALDEKKLRLLHSIYHTPVWKSVLPPLPPGSDGEAGLRRSPRFSLKCPATLVDAADQSTLPTTIIDISANGFQARTDFGELEVGREYTVTAELGREQRQAQVKAQLVRRVQSDTGLLFGFQVQEPDRAWLNCVNWLEST